MGAKRSPANPPAPDGPRVAVGDLGWPLARAARLRGAAVAVVDGERSVTYRQLARRVAGLATGLHELGCRPGDRVGVLAENSLAHFEAWLAVPAHGWVVCDLNFRLAESELAILVDDAELELLLVDAGRLEVARSLRERCPSLRELVFTGPGDCPRDCHDYELLVERPPARPVQHHGDTLAAISYTGGTTGLPKGIMLSHRNLLSNAQHNIVSVGHRADDSFLHVCPMFHVAGTANLLATTWVGGRHVILPRFDAQQVAAAMERERPTLALLVPTMISMLLEHLDDHPADLSSLREIGYAASPITPATQARLLERTECEIAQFYGMTEAAPSVTRLGGEDHRRGIRGEEPHATRLRSVGVPLPGVEVQIHDEAGEEVPVGEVGELCVRGPNVMLGYWRRPEATDAALRDGWYRSGDAARMDEDGYLYVVDRIKDMIISGGENVYSVEVEAALASHPAVSEAAVFGVPDELWGESVHAVVVVESDVAVEALTEHCRTAIAGYKVPRRIDLRRDPLPKSGAGKVLKAKLREPFWEGHERRVS